MSGRGWVVPAIVDVSGAVSVSDEEDGGWEVGWMPVRSVFFLGC